MLQLKVGRPKLTFMTFDKLRAFIASEMRMSQVYQPVMLIQLLQRDGEATVEEIAKAILDKDPTQVEYFTQVVKNMVGKVLTTNRGVTERTKDGYRLAVSSPLSPEQRHELISLCQAKIAEFESKRGISVWQHRRRGHRPVSGSVRYEVLKRARFKCELCGVSAEQKSLEVDHIVPKSLGGKDDLVNYQALCYSCNSAKRNTDQTDFRDMERAYAHRESDCLFCDIQSGDRGRIVTENTLAYVIRDGYPVTDGHTLIVPKRHVRDYFGLFSAEVMAINDLIGQQRAALMETDPTIQGFNIGMNSGEAAGQTQFHCHVHLIPRRQGDVENPRGGVRHVIPGKGNY